MDFNAARSHAHKALDNIDMLMLYLNKGDSDKSVQYAISALKSMSDAIISSGSFNVIIKMERVSDE